jgi:hypothetical protein
MGHRLFRPFLVYLSQELADLPYQRTAVPATTPVEFWQDATDIEVSREEFFRKIACATNGDVHIPYRRHYTNVDEWLRFDEQWIGACDELLVSGESVVRRELIRPECIDALIREHQQHRRSHMQLIHRLLSAELFLRSAAGWSGADLATILGGANTEN